ncbi:MAG: transcription elongation factor GreA [Candidatus Makana argininalis]
MNKNPITLRGIEKLKEELEYLKNFKRQKIINAIINARKHGDLKENSEYHAAKEQQVFCECRIKKIENTLMNSYVIDITKISKKNYIIFGSTVSIKYKNTKEKKKYKIVGKDESDFKKNLISIHSPIARGLIGKKKGDLVKIQTPGGKLEFTVLKIEYL